MQKVSWKSLFKSLKRQQSNNWKDRLSEREILAIRDSKEVILFTATGDDNLQENCKQLECLSQYFTEITRRFCLIQVAWW